MTARPAGAGALQYRVRWKSSGMHPGAIGGVQAGAGHRLRSLVLLRDHPDPRRLDIRTSARDPFERLWVRDFHLDSALKVVVLLDLSASMGFVGAVDRMEVVRDVASQLALSAWKGGDAFGVFGAADQPSTTVRLPPRVHRGAWTWVQKRLAGLRPEGASAAGMAALAPLLPQRRALVFVLSDFRWPPGQLAALLRRLAHHDVVPLVLRDPTEAQAMPVRGLAVLRDAETGAARFAWLRPALRRAAQEAREAHWQSICRDCRATGCSPFAIDGAFDALALSCYFDQRA